jgi:hypothetical protein
MAADQLSQLTSRADAVHNHYRREFAGRSRIGRDATVLDGLIAQSQQIAVEATSLDGAGTLRGALNERIAMYRNERTAIGEAAAGGPALARAYRLHDLSWLDSRRYSRHFAGKSRPTRDLGLLAEMIDGETSRRDELSTLAVDKGAAWRADSIQGMGNGIELYTNERDAILGIRDGMSLAERAQVLATVANDQFGLYRLHFQGQSRRTRRVPLLERIIAQLKSIATEMEGLRDGGLQSESNDGNIGKVRDRLAHHVTELGNIRNARATIRPVDLGTALGEEANGFFKEYREQFAGKPRDKADPAKLSTICDQLLVAAQQMADLHAQTSLESVERNLAITLDNLKAYEREWARMMEARQANA